MAREVKVPSDDEELDEIPTAEEYPHEEGNLEEHVFVAYLADFDQDVMVLEMERGPHRRREDQRRQVQRVHVRGVRGQRAWSPSLRPLPHHDCDDQRRAHAQ
eukprot:4803605-Pyramimonas_sp.AAC.1